MHVFIDFWKLETENSLLYVFSFLHKLNFENSFCSLPILSCQTSFLVLKIENCFWKQKIRGKNSYQTYPKNSLFSVDPFSLSLSLLYKTPSKLKLQPLFLHFFHSQEPVGELLKPFVNVRWCNFFHSYTILLFMLYMNT